MDHTLFTYRNLEELRKIQEEREAVMTITEGIEQRRSIRKYTEQEVEREKIEEVLRAALLAPSGKNRQPCHRRKSGQLCIILAK